MDLGPLDPDRVEAVLVASGALSVTLTDAGDEPVLEPAPGETPLWSDVRLTALFDDRTDLATLPDLIGETLGVTTLPAWRLETVEDRAWEREWLRDFGPMRFGDHLWVIPEGMPAPGGDAVVVRLDPGLAFGTGTHPTTALCLEWLAAEPLFGRTVFDFGCGSGILAIAALRLGAASALAVDIDLQAVSASRQNACKNGVGDRLTASVDAGPPAGRFDFVVANILAGTLIGQADLICEAAIPGGRVALSGILVNQVDDVTDAFRDRVSFDPPVVRDDWALLAGTRK